MMLVREALWKCYICGQYIEERKTNVLTPKKLRVYPRSALVREAAVESTYEASVPSTMPLSSDMVTFIRRISEALTPIKGYEGNREVVARALSVRNQIKSDLTKVFGGEREFDDWFTKTRQDLNLHPMELSQIIYDCLKGLNSEEAKQLRGEYEQFLARNPYSP